MSTCASTHMTLVDQIIRENSLIAVISYITDRIDNDVMIVDAKGKVHSQGSSGQRSKGINADRHVINVMAVEQFSWEDQPYFYAEETGRLYYLIDESGQRGYFIVFDVEWESLGEVIACIKDTLLAVRVYFSKYYALVFSERKYKNEIFQNLLFNNVLSIKEIVRNNSSHGLDFSQIYYVTILKLESKFDIEVLYAYSLEWLRNNSLDIICNIWIDSSIVFICPSHFKDRTLEVDTGWSKHIANITRHKQELTKKFKISVSMGIGQKYPLMEVHKSYQEARAAINVTHIMGHKNFIRHFNELGIFKLLYTQDSATLQAFCDETLGRLIEYDKEHSGEMMATLRCLFDCNMNWKQAAEFLYIHVNTLRYRVSKINEILNVDFYKLETRINLVVAMILRDTLIANEFIEGI